MMNSHITVREWLNNYNNGEYSDKGFDTMTKAGWYDWFCSSKALWGRLRRMAGVIKRVTKDNDFLLDNYYVSFVNCLSSENRLFDVIRFMPMDAVDFDPRMFTISIGNSNIGYMYSAKVRKEEYKDEYVPYDYANDIYNCDYREELVPYVHTICCTLKKYWESEIKPYRYP